MSLAGYASLRKKKVQEEDEQIQPKISEEIVIEQPQYKPRRTKTRSWLVAIVFFSILFASAIVVLVLALNTHTDHTHSHLDETEGLLGAAVAAYARPPKLVDWTPSRDVLREYNFTVRDEIQTWMRYPEIGEIPGFFYTAQTLKEFDVCCETVDWTFLCATGTGFDQNSFGAKLKKDAQEKPAYLLLFINSQQLVEASCVLVARITS
jgi:energy-converting hydrogenase Eha subunit A